MLSIGRYVAAKAVDYMRGPDSHPVTDEEVCPKSALPWPFSAWNIPHTQGGVGECGARDNSSGRARSAHLPTLRPYVYLFAPVAFCSASKTKAIPLPSESVFRVSSAGLCRSTLVAGK